MKKLISQGMLLAVVIASILTSCGTTEPPVVCCDKAYEEFNVEGKTLRIYSAFTPANAKFFDEILFDSVAGAAKFVSFVKVNGVITDTLWEVGRVNRDSVYNDEINEYFYIQGIDQFKNNRLNFFTVKDTTPIFENESLFDNYGNSTGGTVFDGRSIDTTYNSDGKPIVVPKAIASGQYMYRLILYRDANHRDPIDTLSGNFCIIRTPDYEFNETCEGVEESDPVLLKQF